MDIEQAIRTRRTHKAFGPKPVERNTLDELFELARWAPNHHGTNPWRFRVLGRAALTRLKQAAGREHAAKLDRAPTLIVVVAHARGFAGYWRTPAVLPTPEGRAAIGLAPQEHVLGLIHLGPPRQRSAPPEREDPCAYVTYLE
jgi:nitroreductase